MIERYIGGGKLFMQKFNGTTYDIEVEIGEIQSAKLSIKQTYVDAMAKDTGISKNVDKVATATDATFSFTTQNVSKENMALAMFGTLTTESFAIGATLPDGTVATAAIVLPKIKGGAVPKVEGKFKIVAKNISGVSNPVLIVHRAVLTPTGDVRDYFADKHTTLGFDGQIIETTAGYFDEYLIPRA